MSCGMKECISITPPGQFALIVTVGPALLSSVSWSDQSLEFAPLLADLEDSSGDRCRQYCDSQAQRDDFGDRVDDVQTPGQSRSLGVRGWGRHSSEWLSGCAFCRLSLLRVTDIGKVILESNLLSCKIDSGDIFGFCLPELFLRNPLCPWGFPHTAFSIQPQNGATAR